MRAVILLALLAALVPAAPREPLTPLETAALLLSPNRDLRVRGLEQLATNRGAEFEGRLVRQLARWAHNRSGFIKELERQLLRAEGEPFKRLHSMIEYLRNAQGELLNIDVYLLTLPRPLAAALLGPGFATVTDGDPATWERWWRMIRKSNAAVHLRRLLSGMDARRASVAVKRRISYVKEWDHDRDRNVISPVVDMVEAGVELRWLPLLSEDGRYVSIDFATEMSSVVRPMKVMEFDLAGKRVRVQTPERFIASMRHSVSLPVGGHCAWRFPEKKTEDGGRVMVTLLRAVRGTPKELEQVRRKPGDADDDEDGE